MSDKKKAGGLAGVTAGATGLCTVGKEGAGLTYRGYDIYDLADNASFEEVAYLLLHGELPKCWRRAVVADAIDYSYFYCLYLWSYCFDGILPFPLLWRDWDDGDNSLVYPSSNSVADYYY